jgi:outer membrane protein assembly factor BamB
MKRAWPWFENSPRSLRIFVGSVTCLLLTVSWGGAQVPPGSAFHPDSSYAAESLLRSAARHVSDKQWPEAIELYLRVVDQHGDSVAQVPATDPQADPSGTSQLFVNARQYCQAALAGLPAEGVAQYRRRVDVRAEQWFREASKTADRALLRRVVDAYFASSWGDQALDLLGDLEFRSGRFREALGAYHQLVPDPLAPKGLVYPDTDVDVARVAAKILMCRAAMGLPPSAAELEGFRRAYPDLETRLAGRQGVIGSLVAESVLQDKWRPAPAPLRGWPTFAGAPGRNRALAEKVDVGSFQWKIDLASSDFSPVSAEPNDIVRFGGNARPAPTRDTEPAAFPIIVGDLVLVCDESRVQAFHLDARPKSSTDEEVRAETLAWDSPYTPPFSQSSNNRAGSSLTAPRHTLTASGDRIFARLGPTGRGTSGGILYAIRNNREVEGKLIWRKPASDVELPVPQGGERHVASYEGAPVADERRVYMALTEASTDTWAYVACFDAETGQPQWVRHIGSAPSNFDPMRGQQLGPLIGNRLLSLDGGNLYFQLNMGAVASLDAETGVVRWVATYPTPSRGTAVNPKRTPNPAIVADGLVVVAPEDAPGLFAFEKETGKLVWKTQPATEIQHLLGVAEGKLFATGNHLYTFDVKTGRALRVWPEAGARFDGYGRGLLAGGCVYWPTRTEILVIDQATGGDIHESIPLFQSFGYGGGNLAAGDGYLVVAEREHLSVFCQNRRLIERYRDQLAGSATPALDHFELARLAEATGEMDLALESLVEAVRTARGDDLVEGRALVEVARERQHHLLIRIGDEEGAKGRWGQAVEHYTQARDIADGDRQRLVARMKVAQGREAEGRVELAVGALQDLLADERLLRLTVPADSQRQVRVELWVTEQLTRIIDVHGRAAYANYEQRAEELLARATGSADRPLLREVSRLFPVSLAAPKALLALARISEAKGNIPEAIDAYKRLAMNALDESAAAQALAALGELYESQGFLSLAREAYSSALDRFADTKLDGRGETVGAYVGQRMLALSARSSGPAAGGGSAALFRKSARRWDFPARPYLIDDGEGEGFSVVLVDGTKLVLFDLAAPTPAWQVDSGVEPTWIEAHGDLVLVGSNTRVVAFTRSKGDLAWRFDVGAMDWGDKRPSPFARPEATTAPLELEAGVGRSSRLHGFQLVAGRLAMQSSDQMLLTIDADDGRLLWSFKVPPPRVGSGSRASLNPCWLVHSNFVLVELAPTNTLLVLDAESGLRLSELERGEDQFSLTREPILLNSERVVLALDPRTVAVYDVLRGVLVWTYRNESALPRAVSPSVWSSESVLIALFGGQELVRLNPENGKRVWTHGIGLTDLSQRVDAVALDEQRLYCIWGSTYEAFNTSDGSVAWRRTLAAGETKWGLSLTGKWLVVRPSVGRIEEAGLTSLVVLLCHSETGLPSQRFAFNEATDALAMRFDESSALLATQSQAWILGRKAADEPKR